MPRNSELLQDLTKNTEVQKIKKLQAQGIDPEMESSFFLLLLLSTFEVHAD